MRGREGLHFNVARALRYLYAFYLVLSFLPSSALVSHLTIFSPLAAIVAYATFLMLLRYRLVLRRFLSWHIVSLLAVFVYALLSLPSENAFGWIIRVASTIALCVIVSSVRLEVRTDIIARDALVALLAIAAIKMGGVGGSAVPIYFGIVAAIYYAHSRQFVKYCLVVMLFMVLGKLSLVIVALFWSTLFIKDKKLLVALFVVLCAFMMGAGSVVEAHGFIEFAKGFLSERLLSRLIQANEMLISGYQEVVEFLLSNRVEEARQVFETLEVSEWFIGTGFSQDFVFNFDDYIVERSTVHNSYLALYARAGLAGFAVILTLLWLVRRAVKNGNVLSSRIAVSFCILCFFDAILFQDPVAMFFIYWAAFHRLEWPIYRKSIGTVGHKALAS